MKRTSSPRRDPSGPSTSLGCRLMRRCFLPVVLSLSALALQHVDIDDAHAEDEAANRNLQTVAQIDDVVITNAELERELRHQLREQLETFDEKQREFLKRQLLERLVERKLLLRAADLAGLTPRDEEVKAFIAKMRQGLPSEENLDKELAKFGMSEAAFAAGLKEDLAIKEYLDRRVFTDLKLSDAEVEKEFNAQKERFATPEEVRVRHILLRVAEDAAPEKVEETRRKAEEIAREVRAKPSEFVQIARRSSEAENAAKGGDLGFFSRNQMLEEFSNAAFAMKVGEISNPVRTRYGFHIIKLEERRGGEQPEFSEVKEKVRALLLREKREELLAEHLEELRKKHKVIVFYR